MDAASQENPETGALGYTTDLAVIRRLACLTSLSIIEDVHGDHGSLVQLGREQYAALPQCSQLRHLQLSIRTWPSLSDAAAAAFAALAAAGLTCLELGVQGTQPEGVLQLRWVRRGRPAQGMRMPPLVGAAARQLQR